MVTYLSNRGKTIIKKITKFGPEGMESLLYNIEGLGCGRVKNR